MRKLVDIIDKIILENELNDTSDNELVIEVNESRNNFSYSSDQLDMINDEIPHEVSGLRRKKKENSSIVLYTCLIVAVLLIGNMKLTLSIFLIGVIAYVYLRKKELRSSIQRFNYNLSSNYMFKYIELSERLRRNQSIFIWHVIKQPERVDYEKFGINGHIVLKSEVDICEALPSNVRSNLMPIAIKGSSITLVFFPDVIISETKDSRNLVKYADIDIRVNEANIIEDILNPSDSETIGTIRNHPGKGSKDVPIKKYGELTLKTQHESITILTSNVSTAIEIGEALSVYNAFNNS